MMVDMEATGVAMVEVMEVMEAGMEVLVDLEEGLEGSVAGNRKEEEKIIHKLFVFSISQMKTYYLIVLIYLSLIPRNYYL